MNVETTRLAFRPSRITTLFVGESPPFNGAFFYRGNPPMTRVMRRAIEESLGATDNFLETFKAFGWYLDDLVLDPVDHLDDRERRAMCVAARCKLAERVAEYQPLMIVSLLRSIREDVEKAAEMAGCAVEPLNAPFPGGGWHETPFRNEMRSRWATLPRL
jgi:hypothetical protein